MAKTPIQFTKYFYLVYITFDRLSDRSSVGARGAVESPTSCFHVPDLPSPVDLCCSFLTSQDVMYVDHHLANILNNLPSSKFDSKSYSSHISVPSEKRKCIFLLPVI